MRELSDCAIEWHLIGPLQSNKCREVAERFDWMQTLDRAKLIPLLARYRPDGRAPLNVLVQVNLDDEDSKSGAHPADVDALADAGGGSSDASLTSDARPSSDGAAEAGTAAQVTLCGERSSVTLQARPRSAWQRLGALWRRPSALPWLEAL